MKKLSKSNQYAISWLFSQNNSVEDISKELDISIESINAYIEKNENTIKNPIPIKSGPVSSKDLMIRHTRDKKTNSVAIMTKEASEKNDAARPRLNSGSQRFSKDIFRPND